MHHRLLTMFSHSLASLLRTAIGFAHAHRISFKVYDTHNVVLLKFAPHINDAYGKNTDSLVGSKYLCGAIVDVQLSFGKTLRCELSTFLHWTQAGRGNEAGVFQ